LDHGKLTGDSLSRYRRGEKPLGAVGMAHLSAKDRHSRWICSARQPKLLSNPIWKLPYIIEFPVWPSVGINVSLWNDVIKATADYQFHLWFPDIAMQFNYQNYPCLILPNLYCLNHQELKSKYNIHVNSAHGAKEGNEYHFGKYSNFRAWKNRWGWEYENVYDGFNDTKERYKGTLIWDYFHHDIRKGPMESIDL
jgi:hypothetical protein